MRFQATDWFGRDNDERYEIYVSGRTEEAKPVEIKITDFKPYFHILITSKNHSPIPQNITDIIKNDVIRSGIDRAQAYKKPSLDNIVITKTNFCIRLFKRPNAKHCFGNFNLPCISFVVLCISFGLPLRSFKKT